MCIDNNTEDLRTFKCVGRIRAGKMGTLYYLIDGVMRHTVDINGILRFKAEGCAFENFTVSDTGVFRAKGNIDTIELAEGRVRKLTETIQSLNEKSPFTAMNKLKLINTIQIGIPSNQFNAYLKYVAYLYEFSFNGKLMVEIGKSQIDTGVLREVLYSTLVICFMLVNYRGQQDNDKVRTPEFIQGTLKLTQ